MDIPALGDALPRRGSKGLRAFGTFVLSVMGWRIEGTPPNLPKLIIIVAPHTSNWDFVVAMAAALALDLRVHWLGKHTIFRRPFGVTLRKLGGIPVDRFARQGVVAQVVEAFRAHDRFVLGLSPEGTRKKVARWRTGFYNIARAANAPILAVALDFERKAVVIGPLFEATGNLEDDVEKMRAFFAPIKGKRPELF